jgi:hypothetical protein
MTKKDNPKKNENDDNQGARLGEISQKQFRTTTILAVLAIIAAIFAAGFGPYIADNIQRGQKTLNTAKLLYDDIDRMNWTLHSVNTIINNTPPNNLPIFKAPIYDENDVYYSIRPDLPLLDDRIARNVTIFYADMQYAETYRQLLKTELEGKSTFIWTQNISDAYDQFRWAISEANELRPQILNDSEKIYNIQKNPPNRFNRY